MKKIMLFVLVLITLSCVGQDIKTFYDTRVVNGHSVETNQEGVMKFIIAHRFGYVSQGSVELWGLDDSQIRLGLDYGITDRFTIGAGRNSELKAYDGYLKYKIAKQRNNMPVSIVAFGSLVHRSKTLDDARVADLTNTSHRITYSSQLLIASKVSDRISLQLMPTYTYRNLTETTDETNGLISIGTAARYKLFKRLTLSFEYYHTPDHRFREGKRNSLAVGFNIETKGHVFQLHLGNSRGMIEQYFITETTGSWADGNMGIGFNITRDFKLKGH